MQAHEINTIVKQMNDLTERPPDSAALEALRAKSAQVHPLDFDAQQVMTAELAAFRLQYIDLEKRREIVVSLNAEPMYTGYRFRLVNNRIMAEEERMMR